MLGRMADSICPICSSLWPNPKERAEHIAGEHPGYRFRWDGGGQAAVVTAPDGAETRLTRRDFRDLRARARHLAPPENPRDTERRPPADEPDVPPESPPEDSSSPQASIHQDRPRRPRVFQQAETRISRATLSESLSVETLADIIRKLSMVLSEADGAGESGWLSLTESATIATLLYDSTLDVVISRFQGDVGRFKVAIAVLLLVIGKGRVHAQAIGRRLRARQAAAKAAKAPPIELVTEAPADVPYAPGWPTAPEEPMGPPAFAELVAEEPATNGHEPTDLEIVAQRQAAWRMANRGMQSAG